MRVYIHMISRHCLEWDKLVLHGAYLLTWPCQTVYTKKFLAFLCLLEKMTKYRLKVLANSSYQATWNWRRRCMQIDFI